MAQILRQTRTRAPLQPLLLDPMQIVGEAQLPQGHTRASLMEGFYGASQRASHIRRGACSLATHIAQITQISLDQWLECVHYTASLPNHWLIGCSAIAARRCGSAMWV